jgi:hypothetical protein
VKAEQPPLPTLAEVRGMRIDVQVRACQELAIRADRGGLEALEAQRRLGEVVDLLTHELLSQALGAGIGEQGQTLDSLLLLADVLDTTHVTTRHFAPMLRSRALELVEAKLNATPLTTVGLLTTVRSGNFDFDEAAKFAQECLARLSEQVELRARLLSGGATARSVSEQIWRDNAARVLGEVVKIWELACDGFFASLRSSSSGIDGLLSAMRKPLAGMNACGHAFVALGYDRSCVASRVLSTKLMPYVAAALTAEKPRTRQAVAAVIESLLDRLQEADALYVVSSTALTQWAVSALLDVEEAAPTLEGEELPLHFEGYRSLRKIQPSSSLCHALVAACTYIAQYAPELRVKHSPSLELVQAQLSELSVQTVERIRDADERRIRSTLGFFQRWWADLTSEVNTPQLQLDLLVSSRFYELVERESALVRFTLEAELLGLLFPACGDASRNLVVAITAFRELVQAHVHVLMGAQAGAGRRSEDQSENRGEKHSDNRDVGVNPAEHTK